MALNSYISAGIGTSDVSVITASTITTLIGCNLANTTASDINVTLKQTRGATTIKLLPSIVVPANSAYDPIEGNKIVLAVNDVLKVASSVEASLDVNVSVNE